MKRLSTVAAAILLVVMILATSSFGRTFWYQLLPRTFAMLDDGCADSSPCGDPFIYFSRINGERLSAQQRLDTALDELRAQNPQGFDQVMRRFGINHQPPAIQP